MEVISQPGIKAILKSQVYVIKMPPGERWASTSGCTAISKVWDRSRGAAQTFERSMVSISLYEKLSSVSRDEWPGQKATGFQ